VACTLALPARTQAQNLSAPITFRLNVQGTPDRRTTFWVSYGPLAGHFGVLQLHRAAPHLYMATYPMPMRGRTTFYYLAGQGSLETRAGLVPGNPVVTVKQLGPTVLMHAETLTVSWVAPVG
jgi:hypothetical protein